MSAGGVPATAISGAKLTATVGTRDPLNFFEPWESLPASHENQLTRGLLVVLRYSPMAHQVWLSQVQNKLPADERRQLYELPEAEFFTQVQKVPTSASGDQESLRGISVLVAGEAPTTKPEAVTERERGQVLDGVVKYGEKLVVVIESKLDGPVRTRQHEQIRLYGESIEFETPVIVLWPDLLSAFLDLVDKELVKGAEAEILSDFQSVVDRYFSGIAPFPTLDRCRQQGPRVLRRLRVLFSEASLLDADVDRHGARIDFPDSLGGVASRAYLRYVQEDRDNFVEFAIYPGDTLQQARVLFGDPAKVAAIRSLAAQPGWAVRPNFHFGHMQAGYVWCHGPLETGPYLDWWETKIKDARAVPRMEWDNYWAGLLADGIAAPEDRFEFDRIFERTERSTATPRPGVVLTRRWPIAEAEERDARGRMLSEVRVALDTAVSAARAHRT